VKNKHKLFADMAALVAQQSTCCRMQVGAVLVKEGRVISIGFNGVPSGQKHCEDHFKEVYKKDYCAKHTCYEDFIKTKDFFDMHGAFSNDNELHAEQNAILFAARNGIATHGADLYVTDSPCIHCAKIIIAAGIKRVLFIKLYDRSQEGINFLNKNNVECRRLGDEDLKN
jgi:dCMP deaminase